MDTSDLFRNIAITFSGGGYRASSFALGVLSYLNRIKFKQEPLLKQVSGLSTVSGGTITGAYFSECNSAGKTFDEFYNSLYQFLNEDRLLENALKNLESDQTWKDTDKTRSLINAFALAYHQMLTQARMKDIKNQGVATLQDICFNATDFSFGLAYRFQITGDFGNYRLKNEELVKAWPEIRLADAIASSSCFPLGFEPILMPDDFFDHKNDEFKKLKKEEYYNQGIGLMDGGIVDNQGIGSTMNANKRRDDTDKYNLIMVCDVGSYKMTPWKPSPDGDGGQFGSMTLKKFWSNLVKKVGSLAMKWMLPLITTALLIAAILKWPDPRFVKFFFFLAGITLAISLVIFIAIYGFKFSFWLLKKALWLANRKWVPDFLKGKLKYFDDLKFSLLERMIKERITSAETMLNDVFLKQLRRLNYDLLYRDKKLDNKRITNLIYELTENEYKKNESDEKPDVMRSENDKGPEPNDKIFASAKIASDMPTTLWFDEKDRELKRLENLIACGQFTTCFNLMEYLDNLQRRGIDIGEAGKEMMDLMQKDWQEFRNNPLWMT